MAIDFSPSYVAASRRRLRLTPLWFQMKFWKVIKQWRMLRRRFGSKRVRQHSAPCALTANFDAASAHFQQHQWAFIEDILSADFHRELNAHWPRKRYLEPPRGAEKSYDTGFAWVNNRQNAPDFSYCDPYGQYPTILALLNYLRSAEVSRRVTAFAGVGEDLVPYSFKVTDAGSGAEVMPHHDSNKNDPRARYLLNFIFFIDATGGKHSGGLCLSHDNELNDIIFEPTKLKNTCLVYDILGDFYHGFSPIAPGKFRRAIAAQFCQKSYVAKNP